MSPRPERSSWLPGLACAALVIAALVIAHPYAEMGFIDDFAYVKMAQVYAHTGHLVFNGWETAMLGWLVPWGALFIRVFGFSFTIVRLSTLPLVAVSVFLFHASLRRFGVSPRNAVIAVLTLGLSPLFFPLAATYMTDVPGLFCIFVCLYLCQRAVQASSDRASVAWLVAASLTNLLGGTVRQIVWLGALVMVPCAAWLLHRRSVLRAAAVLWGVSFCCVLACMQWFAQQPYVLPEKIYQGRMTPHMIAHGATELLKSVLCLALVTAPLLVGWISYASKLTRAAALRISAAISLLAAAGLLFDFRGTLDQRVMPWLGHIIGTQSIFRSTGEMLGQRPVTLDLPVRAALSLALIALILIFVEFVFRLPRARPQAGLREALWLLVPFTVSYIAFLVPRAVYSFIYDRYLLGLMPAAVVLLVLLYQQRISDRLPRISVITLVCFALYTVAATHDWFALNRARVAAVREVEASGVPDTSIQGGFDYDGWTQIQAAGYINDERLRRPAGAFHEQNNVSTLPPLCRLNFAPFTPAIYPEFFVVFQRMPCLAPSSFGPVSYRTWLPPFQRTIYVQRRPELR